MKPTLKLLVPLTALALATAAYPRAGGGVSVGRASPSAARSYSAPAPRYSAPAPRYTPAPAPRYNAPRYDSPPARPAGGGFWSSFAGGAAGGAVGSVIGNAISTPHAPVVVGGTGGGALVSGGTTVMAAPAPGSTVVVQQGGLGFWGWLLILAAAGGAAWWWFNRRTPTPVRGQSLRDETVEDDEEDWDAIQFFYELQQATMNSDWAALSRMCTPGMAMILQEHPEPGRSAIKTLTGLTFQHDPHSGTVIYSFRDTVMVLNVVEEWNFIGGRLAGIEVRA